MIELVLCAGPTLFPLLEGRKKCINPAVTGGLSDQEMIMVVVGQDAGPVEGVGDGRGLERRGH